MSKFKYLILTLLIFGFGITPVGAICNYEEQARLNREVSNVKVSYEIITQPYADQSGCYPPEDIENPEDYLCKGEFIQINKLNINESMVVNIGNNYYDREYRYNYSDTENGNLSFILTNDDGVEISYNEDVIEYTIEILASSETGCEGSGLRTIYLTVPRYNVYSNVAPCDEMSDYYLCEKYVTYPNVSYEDFSQSIANEIAEREEEEEEPLAWYERLWEFVVEHRTAFIAGGIIIVVAAGGTVAYIIIRRRRDIV